MNLQQSKALFIKTILPFGLVGGLVIFTFSLLLFTLGHNPLAGSPYGLRDIDLILLIVFASVFLIRYNYKFPGNTPFWEVFFVTFISSFFALMVYLVFTLFLSYSSPSLLDGLSELNRKFILENQKEIIEKVGAKGFAENLNNIKTITPFNLFFSELIKKGVAVMFISAFISIAFRFSNLLFLKRKLFRTN